MKGRNTRDWSASPTRFKLKTTMVSSKVGAKRFHLEKVVYHLALWGFFFHLVKDDLVENLDQKPSGWGSNGSSRGWRINPHLNHYPIGSLIEETMVGIVHSERFM
jgi:hypothetical protein